ncbi:MarR family winged helix-turn-helix transcriptional regulator [Micromonospora sp. ATA51]|uniref:MarR family winged helix-turn-helix transcriptional regulator n=1 Tax=Micromonospora sp. ATA51 TaxID=2806098 RepID=UPI001A5B6E88|nr:MarR family winged helix-turn-helix transcriptional regulator [Micromonospora sp. ATA51]MBM0229940.1 winged helix-turn-helix transcriptional regulator [Micromonospora sp. ATA51]
MVDRWTVERAVRSEECDLEPPGRHLVLTLLTWSDAATAMIPEQYTPSLTDLEHATGMARSTVAAWLNRLEKKWVWRDRPSVADARRKKAKTVYRMGVPPELLRRLTERGVVGPRAGPAAPESPGSGSPVDEPVKGASGPGRGLELVRQADRVGPPHGRKTYREQETVGVRAASGVDHRYVEGPNGSCGHPGCRKSAPLHGPALRAVPEEGRRVIGE